MKNTDNRLVTIPVIGLGAIAALMMAFTASTHAVEKLLTPEEGAARMEAARTEIAITRSNIVLTMEQLHLVRSADDPHAQFKKFTGQLARMEERAQLTRERALAMKTKGDAYFADWEAQIVGIQDPETRKQVEASYAKRKKAYDRIIESMQEAGKNFTPMLAELKEIQKLLEGERSREKVAEAKDLFMRANWQCGDVQRSLMAVEREFDTLAADFAGKDVTAPGIRNGQGSPGKDAR